MKAKQSLQRRVVAALELADDAYWQTFAEKFPEAEHGDLSPETTLAYRLVTEAAVAEWVWANVPGCPELKVITKLVETERWHR